MTVGTLPPRAEYLEDGATLVHAVPFQFFDTDELIVTRISGAADVNSQVLTLDVDYTVAGGAGDVGSITKSGGGIVGATLRIQRHTHRSQLLDYEPGDAFPAESHEEGLDRLEMQIQELEDQSLDAEKVRDLLAATLVAGDGIIITVNDEENTITIATRDAAAFPDCIMLSGDQQTWVGDGTELGVGGLDEQDVKDIVADFIKAGAGINVAYDVATNLFTITNAAPGGASITTEDVQDIVAALLQGAGGVTIAYNDVGATLTIDGTDVVGTGGGGGGLSVTDENLIEVGGHVELSDGLIMQWGKVAIAAEGTPTIFFPVPYTTFANVVVSGGNPDNHPSANCRVVAVGLDSFQVVYNDSAVATTFWWQSIGK